MSTKKNISPTGQVGKKPNANSRGGGTARCSSDLHSASRGGPPAETAMDLRLRGRRGISAPAAQDPCHCVLSCDSQTRLRRSTRNQTLSKDEVAGETRTAATTPQCVGVLTKKNISQTGQVGKKPNANSRGGGAARRSSGLHSSPRGGLPAETAMGLRPRGRRGISAPAAQDPCRHAPACASQTCLRRSARNQTRRKDEAKGENTTTTAPTECGEQHVGSTSAKKRIPKAVEAAKVPNTSKKLELKGNQFPLRKRHIKEQRNKNSFQERPLLALVGNSRE